ncbi:hypothetical protein E5A73_16310 [Sphingomonas gei]|uniref:Uncharacterized protein n=1 Tax=Sphingomonas gei TaxID=1395960 RepID=A0A4S1XBX6_9SPHN|nr:hypothetical protein [Sphingomonas gei]TGX52356.1 hypothetical protein E5A73_16310 [Sphingomonas gei]
MGRLATLERPSEHSPLAQAAAMHTACPKCGGASTGGTCAECDQETATFAPPGARPANDFSQVPLHGGGPMAGYNPDESRSGEFVTFDGGLLPMGPAGPVATNRCSPTGAQFTSIPSGTLTPALVGGGFRTTFRMEGNFSAAIPCTCALGVYRQYIRGYAKVDGTAVNHPLLPGTTLHPTTYQEDGTPAGEAYGHREAPGVSGNRYRDDQAGGCTFEGRDTPGFPNVAPGHTFEINLDFRGELKDTTNGNVFTSSTWSVVGSVTIP